MNFWGFSVVPVEVARDVRLGPSHMAVLIGLYSFLGWDTRPYWPGLDRLSERIEADPEETEELISELVGLEWLRPLESGGYEVQVPDLLLKEGSHEQ